MMSVSVGIDDHLLDCKAWASIKRIGISGYTLETLFTSRSGYVNALLLGSQVLTPSNDLGCSTAVSVESGLNMAIIVLNSEQAYGTRQHCTGHAHMVCQARSRTSMYTVNNVLFNTVTSTLSRTTSIHSFCFRVLCGKSLSSRIVCPTLNGATLSQVSQSMYYLHRTR